MCTLRAGGELLSMFATWSFEVAPLKLIRGTVKEICQDRELCLRPIKLSQQPQLAQDQSLLVLLEPFQHLGCGPPVADLEKVTFGAPWHLL